ncbi:Poly(ADP-ribose) glycohydrolase [Hypsibius exemplaris]|uniref:poly(ADP-ribose) glycohydrolase n=1 Tax=Hypsibius exemplaris TaxID=2072580 RepID=A0A9X6RNI3_HYPEX|nr:Poly(ADP-ribose) glycohydrolase [Hypsibius exemplaris]
MAEDNHGKQPRHFRQSAITNFFARTLPTPPPTVTGTKRNASSSNVTRQNGGAQTLVSEGWEVLGERQNKHYQHGSFVPDLPAIGVSTTATISVNSMEASAASSFVDRSDDTDDDAGATVGDALKMFEEDDAIRGDPLKASRDGDEMTDASLSVSSSMVVDSESAGGSVPTPDWSGVALSQLTRCLIPSDLRLPSLGPAADHTLMVAVPLVPGKELAPSPSLYNDVWDFDHVRLPSSSRLRRTLHTNGDETVVTRWELIQNNVLRNYQSITDIVPAIASYYTGIFNTAMVTGLVKTVKEELTPQQSHFFVSTLLPFIASLVIELPSSCTQPIPLLKSGMNHTITFSQRQVASLLANAFFCTFPAQKSVDAEREPGTGYPFINFDWLFCSPRAWREKRSQCKSEKLKCIMNYFCRIRDSNPIGLVSYTRRSIILFPEWADSQTLLSKAHITHKGNIEDDGAGCLQVDFANKMIGGGVLQEGCVQEEIRFVLNPELIASRLFTECLLPNEAVIITGAERFSDYSGYGDTFTCAGPHVDNVPRDTWGRRMTQIVAIDAYKFGKTETQYQQEFLLRELNKAYVGFCRGADHVTPDGPLSAVCTGNWGCGAFRGEPRLKFLLQLMACSEAGRDMMYVTFGDARLQEELAAMYEHLVGMNATVGDIFRIISLYHDDVIMKSSNRKKRSSLYSFMYACFNGP